MLDFLFPNYTCLICKSELNLPQNLYLCDKCASDLPINTEPVTYKDQKQKQYFYKAFAAFLYSDPIAGLILRLKYNDDSQVATALAPYMAAAWLRENETVSPDTILVPVPLCKKREKSRGYNQALLLAKEISAMVPFPVSNDAIIRVKVTSPQKEMTVRERANNLKNAFVIKNAFSAKDKKIILVDDVFTSGSTVNECARILMQAGAKEVNVLVIAAVV